MNALLTLALAVMAQAAPMAQSETVDVTAPAPMDVTAPTAPSAPVDVTAPTGPSASVDLSIDGLSGPYTLTAYAPNNYIYNGLKVNNLNLFQAKVGSYCPQEVATCPNGSDMAFVNTLAPLTEVPGGQDLYVNSNGLLAITAQHSHAYPPTAFANGEGWTWTPAPEDQEAPEDCPADDEEYNCATPTGWFTFVAPGDEITGGGLMACPNQYNGNITSIYAVTPTFKADDDCVDLVGLATHPYSGPNPPVWAY